jgi:soluble lytic murein transglycosylase-like protein
MSVSSMAFAACILAASNTYHVPPAVMIGIMQVEGGHVGQQVLNFNGTYDLGPMQVNTIWMPQLARQWHVNVPTAKAWVRDDACTNVYVAAWILKQKIAEGGSLYNGIAHYHSMTYEKGSHYASQVITAMDRKGLVNHDMPMPNRRPEYLAER